MTFGISKAPWIDMHGIPQLIVEGSVDAIAKRTVLRALDQPTLGELVSELERITAEYCSRP
ncbi:hypothetical protein [Actinomadura sp. 6N118]|uniref:hypothetical protein n=1 Tax=Actinomadura sp. 6N118 TaxID=3375151 RepID=UPI003788AFD9